MRVPKTTFLFWVTLSLLLFLFGRGQSLLSPSLAVVQAPLINEFLASNQNGLIDEDGETADWIEIYNPSDQTINLSGWALTDDLQQPEKWRFPDRALGGQEYLLVFASGKNRKPVEPDRNLHANFRLNRQGEFLALYHILDDALFPVSETHFPPQFKDTTYGYHRDTLAYQFLTHPTPGAPNQEVIAWQGVTSAVIFSAERGFYDEPFTLELTTTTPEATIYYTLDGSEPTESNGLLYQQPLIIDRTSLVRAFAVKPNYRVSAQDTHSYIFLDDVLSQPADPPGFSPTWGIHSKDIAGYQKGAPVMADYAMDPEIVNDERYRERIKNDLKSIPTLSLVTAMENLRIYGEPRKQGREWERPASIELIYSDQAAPGFQINAGLRMQGGEVRWEYIPKHSFRLFFREQYGAAKLDYPLFPDGPVDSFNTLILRAGTSESFAGRPRSDPIKSTYSKDQWLRDSQIAMSGLGSRGTFVHLYLNGLYWGLYNLVERPDAAFTASYLGGDKEDWFAMSHGYTPERDEEAEPWYAVNHGQPISGLSDRYETLHRLVREGNFADPQSYALIKEYIDTAHFIDYILLNWYAGRHGDWARNNWYAGVRNPNGQVRYFMWDGENILTAGPRIYLGDEDAINMFKPLFEALWQNPDFRIELADRTYRHLFNDGALTAENAQQRWQSITDMIDGAIVAESARWGDVRYETPITRANWIEARDQVWRQLANNGKKLLAQMREAGYYPPFDPPTFSRQGGNVGPNFVLHIAPPGNAVDAVIYYTTDGSDPRLPVTGDISPSAQRYEGPLRLEAATQLRARALLKNDLGDRWLQWSALQEATFQIVTYPGSVQLTELMYHPPEGDDYEFIELTNTGALASPVANMSFSGIKFTFPPNTPPLAPGDTVVLVRNPAAFREKYPGVKIGGRYDGQLSNKGEALTLYDSLDQVVLSVTYDDENGWPLSADGTGDSLVLIDGAGDSNNPASWRASPNQHGSPGVAENMR